MKDYNVLKKLIYTNGPTGFEDEIQKLFTKLISPYVNKIYTDNIGNVYGEITGSEEVPKIMINAHCDSIGFMVKYIDDYGFIYTQDLPGHITTDYRMLPGTDVLIKSRKTGKFVSGSFIPSQPIHKLDEADLMESEDRENVAIDIGSHSKKQTLSYISIGDYVVLEPNSKLTDVGKRIIGTSLDDRLGLFCLIMIAQELIKSRIKKKPTVIFVSTVCEENFIGAAAVAAKKTNADIALTIDCTTATDQVVSDGDNIVGKKYGWISLDGGVALARGFAVTDSVFLELERICEKTLIPYQIDVCGEGSENEQIQPVGGGIKTGLLSIPTRNLHTRIEMAAAQDVENLIKLAVTFVKATARK